MLHRLQTRAHQLFHIWSDSYKFTLVTRETSGIGEQIVYFLFVIVWPLQRLGFNDRLRQRSRAARFSFVMVAPKESKIISVQENVSIFAKKHEHLLSKSQVPCTCLYHKSRRPPLTRTSSDAPTCENSCPELCALGWMKVLCLDR